MGLIFSCEHWSFFWRGKGCLHTLPQFDSFLLMFLSCIQFAGWQPTHVNSDVVDNKERDPRRSCCWAWRCRWNFSAVSGSVEPVSRWCIPDIEWKALHSLSSYCLQRWFLKLWWKFSFIWSWLAIRIPKQMNGINATPSATTIVFSKRLMVSEWCSVFPSSLDIAGPEARIWQSQLLGTRFLAWDFCTLIKLSMMLMGFKIYFSVSNSLSQIQRT